MSTATQETLGLKSDAPAAPAKAPIILTEKAAAEVKKIIADQVAAGETRTLHLRMRVVGGGCSGFQHKLDLDPEVNPKLDGIFEMQGVTVDFHNDLNRRGFSVTNPQAKSTCGCGSSFSM